MDDGWLALQPRGFGSVGWMNMDGYGLYSYDVMDILRLRAGTWRLDAGYYDDKDMYGCNGIGMMRED